MIFLANLRSEVEIASWSFITYHVTSSVHGGTVNEPLNKKYLDVYKFTAFATCAEY